MGRSNRPQAAALVSGTLKEFPKTALQGDFKSTCLRDPEILLGAGILHIYSPVRKVFHSFVKQLVAGEHLNLHRYIE